MSTEEVSTADVSTTQGEVPVAVAFPPPEIKQICDEIVSRYPTRMAACLPVLHVAQKHYGGWISPEVEAGMAPYLEVSDAHIRGLLTFYAMYNTKPSGRHEVWVCRTLTCWLRGARKLRQTALDTAMRTTLAIPCRAT